MWRPESIHDESGHLDEGVLHGWLDGALDAESAGAAAAHAAACGQCAARAAEARGLIAGAGRVLGALDDVPTAGRPPVAAVRGSAPPESGTSASRVTRTAGYRRLSRISMAAAAVFVFAAGALVLRDQADRSAVREAIESRTEMASAVADSPAGSVEETATAPPGLGKSVAAASAPPRAEPAPTAGTSSKLGVRDDVTAAPGRVATTSPAPMAAVAAPFAADPAVPAPAPPASDDPVERQRRRPAFPAGVALEAVVVTGVQQDRSEAASAAWMIGCWRLSGTDTLLSVSGPQRQASLRSGTTVVAERVVAGTRDPVAIHVPRDSTGPVRIRWTHRDDLVIWPGSDSVRVALASRAGLPMAPTARRAAANAVASAVAADAAGGRMLSREPGGACAPPPAPDR